MPFGGLSSILDKARADSTMVALPVALSTMSVIRDSSASPASSHLLADRRTVSRDLLFASAYTPEQRRQRRARTLHREQTRSPLGRTFSGTLQWSQTKGWPRQTRVGLWTFIARDALRRILDVCKRVLTRIHCSFCDQNVERKLRRARGGCETRPRWASEKEVRVTHDAQPYELVADTRRQCNLHFGSPYTRNWAIRMTAGGKTGIELCSCGRRVTIASTPQRGWLHLSCLPPSSEFLPWCIEIQTEHDTPALLLGVALGLPATPSQRSSTRPASSPSSPPPQLLRVSRAASRIVGAKQRQCLLR
jgi:hypothetical protein